MKRFLALLLALCLTVGLSGCNRGQGNPAGEQQEDYDALSQRVYQNALGEFYTAYQEALAEDELSERYGKMAIAEAKLLSSAVMLPMTSQGGNYAISRLAPRTTPQVLWGNDPDRCQYALVTTKPIRAEHRQEMEENYERLRLTGNYLQWAKKYLNEQGYTLKSSYSRSYSADPKTWDDLSTARATDSDAIVLTYDGLYRYDCEGQLQGALAKDYRVAHHPDGTVSYTFTLKPDLRWVDSQGREVAKVKADDFVAGMQHLLDAGTGPVYLVQGVVQNASEYLSGEVTDFNLVGVKAEDEYTLTYHLCSDIPYFLSMLSYSVFAPMSREFYRSQGGKFGSEFDPSAQSYTYGRTPDNIAYCGGYLVTNHTSENTIVFRANPAYWDAENVTVDTVTWLFNDGKDVLKSYTDTIAGTIDFTELNASAVEKARSDGNFETYAYVTDNEAGTQMMFLNLHRQATANFNDPTIATSGKTQQEYARTNAAMGNVHFRRAVLFSLNRSAYHAQSVGEALKLTSLRNTYTPGNFVRLPEAVTVKIGNEERVFPADTPYGEIVQAQLDADSVGLRVWEEGSSDGFDGWYDPERAMQELKLAMEELSEQGLAITKENPIRLEIPYFSGSEVSTNRVNACAQSIHQGLQGLVRIEPVACTDKSQVSYAGFYITFGSEANYDLYDNAGWSPDYGDPQTYLNTLLPDYQGDMTKLMGIF